MRISILDIGILIFSIVFIIFSIVKTHLINKSSGKIIIRKRLDNKYLLIVITALIVNMFIDIYIICKDGDLHILTNTIAFIIFYLFIIFFSSSRFYTIYEKGLCLGFLGFSKWRDIKKYEFKKDGTLIFKTNKKGIPGEIKIKEQNIKTVEELLEKNVAL
ncbi:DUF5673 domain-containing protein [Clostridium oceanicum]|uniref:DUF5673 domain-containing protein n=1 Tax=Clostridium oceanicum TaxID=1543 RepID=A0ABP3UPQ0_9CLOT